jgi:hypothetical protein
MGPYERGCGVTSAEQRGPSVCSVSFNREGKDEMIKASIDLLRRDNQGETAASIRMRMRRGWTAVVRA